MRLFVLIAAVFSLAISSYAGLPDVKRIVFVGDSITYGGGYIEFIEAAMIAAHPDQVVEVLNIGLPSETVSGLSEDGHAGGKFPRPDLHERLDRVLAKSKPNLVIACYGMNDGIYYPLGEERFAAYRAGMEKLREKVAAAGAAMLHLTPAAFDPIPIKAKVLPAGLDAYPTPYEGYDEVLSAYTDWLISRRADGWDVVDVHGAMKAALAEHRRTDPAFSFSKDGIHPNSEGHLVMAHPLLDAWELPVDDQGVPVHPQGAAILKLIQEKQRLLKDAWLSETGHKRPGMKQGLPLAEAQAKAAKLDAEARTLARQTTASALPPATGDWNGYAKHDIDFHGKKLTIVEPKQAAPGIPWVWHGEFFGHKPAPDIALLGKGLHIVYLSLPNMLGCPDAVAQWNALYLELTGKYGFGKKAALVGLSRGGLYCYNWAEANPDKVACIYGDAPVCDFKSWPGGKGKGKGDPTNWGYVQKLWGFKSEEEAMAYTGNPVDNLAPLAAEHVPLLHVYGDADDVVPWDENTGLIAERYKALGGTMELIAKPGVGHHPHGLDDSTPIIDFILKHTSAVE
ncbi:MAG: prolyl oligopeptidase family serine peptidase [Verrucomicrobiales bacterium]|nr:prolyl oligopeptidase family serine peptidase [Verrucomicrobiales bacterium]MCP5559573.1 prolyl oligopeptidase family serine peptidase [Verrucomicrobiaceae bacterium]